MNNDKSLMTIQKNPSKKYPSFFHKKEEYHTYVFEVSPGKYLKKINFLGTTSYSNIVSLYNSLIDYTHKGSTSYSWFRDSTTTTLLTEAEKSEALKPDFCHENHKSPAEKFLKFLRFTNYPEAKLTIIEEIVNEDGSMTIRKVNNDERNI